MKEIATEGRIAYPSLKVAIPKLLEWKLVVIEKRHGRIALYRINRQTRIVKKLYELDAAILAHAYEEDRTPKRMPTGTAEKVSV